MLKTVGIIICGIGAGFVNGLLGTGGGILLIFALNKMVGGNNKDIYALTLTVTLALSLASVFMYMNKSDIDLAESLKYGISAIPGGLVGGYLLDRLDGVVVKKMFALLLIVAGANMAGLF